MIPSLKVRHYMGHTDHYKIQSGSLPLFFLIPMLNCYLLAPFHTNKGDLVHDPPLSPSYLSCKVTNIKELVCLFIPEDKYNVIASVVNYIEIHSMRIS